MATTKALLPTNNSRWWTNNNFKWCNICNLKWCIKIYQKILRAIQLFKMEFKRPCKLVNFILTNKQSSKFNLLSRLLSKITRKVSKCSLIFKINRSCTSIFLIRLHNKVSMDNTLKNETLELLRLIRDKPWF